MEVPNKNESSGINDVIYRQPCIEGDDYNEEYQKCLVQKFIAHHKKLIIAKDFNVYLLSSNTHKGTFVFF